MQRVEQEWKTQLLGAAAPIETLRCEHVGEQDGREDQCDIFPAEEPHDLLQQKKIRSCPDDFHKEDTMEGGAGDQRTESVQKIQIRPLLIEQIPIDQRPMKHGFAHGKITVGVIPVVIRVQEGRPCEEQHQEESDAKCGDDGKGGLFFACHGMCPLL